MVKRNKRSRPLSEDGASLAKISRKVSTRDKPSDVPTAALYPIVQTSLMLQLARETQIEILSYILVRSDRPRVQLYSAKARRWRNEIRDLRHRRQPPRGMRFFKKSDLLNILLVCRDFYFAGIEAFYGGSNLQFDHFAHLEQLCKQLDVDRKRCIRHVSISLKWISCREYRGLNSPVKQCAQAPASHPFPAQDYAEPTLKPLESKVSVWPDEPRVMDLSIKDLLPMIQTVKLFVTLKSSHGQSCQAEAQAAIGKQLEEAFFRKAGLKRLDVEFDGDVPPNTKLKFDETQR